MGHYDDCRPENCGICGQAKGYCVHTRGNTQFTTFKREDQDGWKTPTYIAPPMPEIKSAKVVTDKSIIEKHPINVDVTKDLYEFFCMKFGMEVFNAALVKAALKLEKKEKKLRKNL